MASNWFTPTPFKLTRLSTELVQVGALKIGGKLPIRVQSMANTSTHQVDDSVQQAIDIIEAGGELVRYAVITNKDAEALKYIKEQLLLKGYSNPIAADIHFNPALADIAAKYVDKVRINPGNYLDKRATFSSVEFTDAEYAQELLRLKERFVSFLNICKKHQTAIRIGTNHGSLSDRIMSRFGDSPEGMVEATMEFLRICKAEDFTNVVVSLKSSNTRIMVYACRLLAQQMQKENMLFALHLGVTEAGSGEDGRIKSAVGMGTLMHDGLGDTIRVSLTENPAKEIPVAKALVSHFEHIKPYDAFVNTKPAFNPFSYKLKNTRPLFEKALVVCDLSAEAEFTSESFLMLGFVQNPQTGVFSRTDLAPDVLYFGEQILPFTFDKDVTILSDSKYWNANENTVPLFAWEEYKQAEVKANTQNWVQINLLNLNEENLAIIKNDPTLVLVCFSYHVHPTQEIRVLINTLMQNQITHPVIILQNYTCFNTSDFQLQSAADNGLFFIDGMADGLWLKSTFKESHKLVVETAFGILQASRTRITKTEYISCPSCGRTLFDLEASLTKVKEATTHLRGLKIAVMGCIVNGPGEMADADFGYVGSGPGKVSLYKGKNLIKRNVDAENAVEELLALIESNTK
jgi:(E)-4-hydroxy-3-methylbut-2-enyl-diphosphate synthase